MALLVLMTLLLAAAMALLVIPVGTRRVAPRVGALVLLALLILVTAAVLVFLRLRHDRIVRVPFRWGDNFCGSDSRFSRSNRFSEDCSNHRSGSNHDRLAVRGTLAVCSHSKCSYRRY